MAATGYAERLPQARTPGPVRARDGPRRADRRQSPRSASTCSANPAARSGSSPGSLALGCLVGLNVASSRGNQCARARAAAALRAADRRQRRRARSTTTRRPTRPPSARRSARPRCSSAGSAPGGYAIRRDLSFLYRFAFWALLALIVAGFVLIFVHIPGAYTAYAIARAGGLRALHGDRLQPPAAGRPGRKRSRSRRRSSSTSSTSSCCSCDCSVTAASDTRARRRHRVRRTALPRRLSSSAPGKHERGKMLGIAQRLSTRIVSNRRLVARAAAVGVLARADSRGARAGRRTGPALGSDRPEAPPPKTLAGLGPAGDRMPPAAPAAKRRPPEAASGAEIPGRGTRAAAAQNRTAPPPPPAPEAEPSRPPPAEPVAERRPRTGREAPATTNRPESTLPEAAAPPNTRPKPPSSPKRRPRRRAMKRAACPALLGRARTPPGAAASEGVVDARSPATDRLDGDQPRRSRPVASEASSTRPPRRRRRPARSGGHAGCELSGSAVRQPGGCAGGGCAAPARSSRAASSLATASPPRSTRASGAQAPAETSRAARPAADGRCRRRPDPLPAAPRAARPAARRRRRALRISRLRCAAAARSAPRHAPPAAGMPAVADGVLRADSRATRLGLRPHRRPRRPAAAGRPAGNHFEALRKELESDETPPHGVRGRHRKSGREPAAARRSATQRGRDHDASAQSASAASC